MKRQYIKYLIVAFGLCLYVNVAEAQKKKPARTATKRASTRKTTAAKTKASIQPTVP